MTSPSLELQGAVIARLKSDATLAALVGNRIYDNVPQNAAFPHVTFEDSIDLPLREDCIPALDVSFQIDVWSRAVGFPECRLIADAIQLSLDDADMALDVNALVLITHDITRYLRDPDGLTRHAAMNFTAIIERR